MFAFQIYEPMLIASNLVVMKVCTDHLAQWLSPYGSQKEGWKEEHAASSEKTVLYERRCGHEFGGLLGEFRVFPDQLSCGVASTVAAPNDRAEIARMVVIADNVCSQQHLNTHLGQPISQFTILSHAEGRVKVDWRIGVSHPDLRESLPAQRGDCGSELQRAETGCILWSDHPLPTVEVVLEPEWLHTGDVNYLPKDRDFFAGVDMVAQMPLQVIWLNDDIVIHE